MYKKFIIGTIIFVFGTSITWNNQAWATVSDTLIKKDIPTMDFNSFESFLHQTTDTTYIINFWATWCKPCVEELPVFEAVNKKHASQKVKVILVSLDLPENKQTVLSSFIQKHHIQSQIILLDDPDFNSWIEKVSPTWSGAIPATIIYNQKKRQFYEQSFTYDTLVKQLSLFIH